MYTTPSLVWWYLPPELIESFLSLSYTNTNLLPLLSWTTSFPSNSIIDSEILIIVVGLNFL